MKPIKINDYNEYDFLFHMSGCVYDNYGALPNMDYIEYKIVMPNSNMVKYAIKKHLKKYETN